MPKTLLLADDSVTIQRVIELTFASEDIRVVSVNDGTQALEWIEKERPDIVVADVGVPNTDGYAIVQHVKKSPALRHIPVLLLAGAFEPVDEGRARASGSDGVLVKPFEPKHLVARVKELLVDSERWAPANKAGVSGGGFAKLAAAPGDPRGGGRVHQAPPAGPRGGGPAVHDTSEQGLEVDQTGSVPERLELPTSPIWAGGGSTSAAPAAAPAKVSLATAFSELLAAEQTRPAAPAAAAPAPPQVSEAMVEEVVRRVLAKMSADTVRQIVLDTAEKLIREEIEKIKANPE